VVVRHDVIHDGLVEDHGTESTGRTRSGRAMEIYNNQFIGTDINKFVGGSRGSTVLFHDNTVTGYWTGLTQFALAVFREFNGFSPWGGADGTNQWDKNQGPFYSGTATTGGNLTVTVVGANWVLNQWTGYQIKKTSGTPDFSQINSNTSNTFTFQDRGGYCCGVYAGGPQAGASVVG